jgi:DNA-binding response OmpR family regulator
MSTVHSTQPDPRILLAEADESTRTLLADNLTADGYRVDTAVDRNDALARLRTIAPDLILADVNSKTLSLLDWIRSADTSLCAIASDTPVIVLTSDIDDVHHVRLLERGGDDVVLKPFSYPELRARIAAVLRRTAPRQPQPVLSAGPVRIDLRQRAVTVAEQPVELSALEYQLLCHLAAEPSRVFTREELMRDVWGYTAAQTRTLDSHASRLRRKLAQAGAPNMIVNLWAIGYRLNPSQ